MFKTLASKTRRDILKILMKEEMHISGLAKRIGISTPVAAKHVKILEDKGLVQRRKFGRTHVLRAKMDRLYKALDEFGEAYNIKMPRGSNLLDALKKVSGIEVKKVREREFMTSIDGEEGYYIYEVNGHLPKVPMEKYKLKKDIEMELKKLVPVRRKKMIIKVR